MDIKTFFTGLDADQKRAFAKAAGTSVPTLSQIAHGTGFASPKRARELVAASEVMFPDNPARQLALSGIRPDIWQ